MFIFYQDNFPKMSDMSFQKRKNRQVSRTMDEGDSPQIMPSINFKTLRMKRT